MVNSMVREIAKEIFVVEDCNREIIINEFGQQTKEVVVNDVVTMDKVATLSVLAFEIDFTKNFQDSSPILINFSSLSPNSLISQHFYDNSTFLSILHKFSQLVIFTSNSPISNVKVILPFYPSTK